MSIRDPLAGKYTHKNQFKHEFETARQRLAHLGGKLIPGVHDYEAFIYEGAGVRLVFYPHTVSTTGNQHIRVRATGKPDPKALRAAIFALAENTCTFQFPADRQLHGEAVSAAIRRERDAMQQRRSA